MVHLLRARVRLRGRGRGRVGGYGVAREVVHLLRGRVRLRGRGRGRGRGRVGGFAVAPCARGGRARRCCAATWLGLGLG